MPDIDTARMRRAHCDTMGFDEYYGTHHNDCVYIHEPCAIAALCDALDAARARVAELETVQAIRAGWMESALTDIRKVIIGASMFVIDSTTHSSVTNYDRLRIIDGLAAEGLSEPDRHWVTVSNEFVREDENEVGLKGE